MQLRIESLPASFFTLSSLERLYLSDNELTALSAEFGGLSNLRILALRNNQLTKMSDVAVEKLTKLVELHLQGIKWFPVTCALAHLRPWEICAPTQLFADLCNKIGGDQ